jgi:hypothetical protein
VTNLDFLRDHQFWKNGILAFKTFEELVDCSSLEDPLFHHSTIPVFQSRIFAL